MPGFLETTVYTGYGYIDPYITDYVSPHLAKARNTVPLIDRAAKGAEEVVPSLITRVDEFTEPRIEKMRPIVEPKIEQVKECVTPYVDVGVKKYENIKSEGNKYLGDAIQYKKNKLEQINSIKDAKINWCKTLLTAKSSQVNQLFRVKSTDNVEGLKFQGVLGKVAALLDKTEGLVDKSLPALPKGTPAFETEYDDSFLLPRMFLLIMSVKMRLVCAVKTKSEKACGVTKTYYEQNKCEIKKKMTCFVTTADAKIKAIVEPKVKQLKAIVEPKIGQVKAYVSPKATKLVETKEYKKACELACKGLTFSVKTCEKVIGKEKTKTLIQAVESRIPASWKAAPAPPKKLK
jgi:hypothetical protein